MICQTLSMASYPDVKDWLCRVEEDKVLATVSMTRLFTVDLVDGNKLELI